MREQLADMIMESLTDHLAQRGDMSADDPYAGWYIDGHHYVVIGLGAGAVQLMVDGQDWDVVLVKRRRATR